MMQSNTAEYWNGKEERAILAQKHIGEMQEKYSTQVNNSINNSKIYDGRTHTFPSIYQQRNNNNFTEIVIEDKDIVTTILEQDSTTNKIAALNFASFKIPGGKFLEGSKAQEECLCHESTLYNVLINFNNTFYKENQQLINRHLYHNRAIYTPDIIFTREKEQEENSIQTTCNIITCASPNKTSAQKYSNITEKENNIYLQSRIRFILNIAAENNIDILILGAYGCGVFGQNPKEVANIFKEYIINDTKFRNIFRKIIFAIPSGNNNNNLKSFREIFNQKK